MREPNLQYPGVLARGFTLLELLIVMVIITLVVGFVAPRLTGFTAGQRVANAARQIVSLARYAHSQAISDGRAYRLNVDPSAGQYWLTADKDGEFTAPTNEFGQRYSLPDGVTMQTDIAAQTTGGQYVTFKPTGLSEPAKVTLIEQDGRQIVVTCASATELFHIAQPGEVTQ